MITEESLEKLAKQFQTSVFPNVIREYFQHVFLGELYKLPESDRLLFKGGTALRIIYNSPRFSEDLDFTLYLTPTSVAKPLVESLFVNTLRQIEKQGVHVEIGNKSDTTSGGYFGVASFVMRDYSPVNVEINVSTRDKGSDKGEVDTIACDFVPTYTLFHLPQQELVDEKVFGALLERKKPRDFYDLYFMMRKNMLSADQKMRLASVKELILEYARSIDFRTELGAFLPSDQHVVIRNFTETLGSEINRQIT